MSQETVVVYHNPRCGKSRSACAILAEKGVPVQVVEYLKTPPGAEELRGLLAKLGMRPEELLRKNEAVFKEQYKGKSLSDEEWIAAMVAHPILIERPIVVRGGRGVVGRPPEKVLELF